jgi:hypothetical protein
VEIAATRHLGVAATAATATWRLAALGIAMRIACTSLCSVSGASTKRQRQVSKSRDALLRIKSAALRFIERRVTH